MKNTDRIRIPAVAGRFYTAAGSRLREELEGYLASPAAPVAKAYGVMVPHAGYMYSGGVCGRALASIEVPRLILIVHTKHQLGGGDLSLAMFEQWETPLGNIQVAPRLNANLAALPEITASNHPHFTEHAAEVVLPFLKVLQENVRVSVLSVMRTPFETLRQASKGIARALLQINEDFLVIASSDMNHYADQQTTLAKDKLALDRLAAFDAKGLLETCEAHDITMCGAHATALMLEVCRELGATRVELLEHTTSGEVSHDYEHVVGYATARVL
jgi:MEMO1 family protein